MKKSAVTTAIQGRLISTDWPKFPETSPLVSVTVCVRGRMAFAIICMNAGRSFSGKNVPLSKNIGVMNRKLG